MLNLSHCISLDWSKNSLLISNAGGSIMFMKELTLFCLISLSPLPFESKCMDTEWINIDDNP